jgi:hypothetical protein
MCYTMVVFFVQCWKIFFTAVVCLFPFFHYFRKQFFDMTLKCETEDFDIVYFVLLHLRNMLGS